MALLGQCIPLPLGRGSRGMRGAPSPVKGCSPAFLQSGIHIQVQIESFQLKVGCWAFDQKYAENVVVSFWLFENNPGTHFILYRPQKAQGPQTGDRQNHKTHRGPRTCLSVRSGFLGGDRTGASQLMQQQSKGRELRLSMLFSCLSSQPCNQGLLRKAEDVSPSKDTENKFWERLHLQHKFYEVGINQQRNTGVKSTSGPTP